MPRRVRDGKWHGRALMRVGYCWNWLWTFQAHSCQSSLSFKYEVILFPYNKDTTISVSNNPSPEKWRLNTIFLLFISWWLLRIGKKMAL
jgi:hypothetical protein